MKQRSVNLLGDAVIILVPVVLLAWWEFAGRTDTQVGFFFSYPSAVLLDLLTGLTRDRLWEDTLYTTIPAAIGLLLGAVAGGSLGFAIIARPHFAQRITPAVAALGAFPVFAIAPMTLIWFGLGIGAKIFLAFLSCVFVFLQAAHRGGLSVPPSIIQHLRVHGFGARDELFKVRIPYAFEWLAASFKSSANLALLGVFIGEFIAAQHGLARVMLTAGALYDVKRVLAAATLFTLVAIAFMLFADLVYSRRSSVLRLISVSHAVRSRRG